MSDHSVSIIQGDCVEAMAAMEPGSVDAIVCDPPYGLEFMGKEWDRLAAAPRGRTADSPVTEPTIEQRDDSPQHRAAVRQPSYLLRCARCGGNSSGAWGRCSCETPDFRERTDLKRAMQDWHEAWAREAFRVLKPGGHLLAFGGTRTYHRLACGLEDAGFEIRDTIAWMYGSGFPKSLDVSKAIDKAAGAEREVVGRRNDGRYAYGFEGTANRPTGAAAGSEDAERIGGFVSDKAEITAPATPEAAQWEGWGTALKPAHEPIVVARKPLVGTVAANVLAHGTGALNIDGCRIGSGTGGGREGEPSAERRYADVGSTNFAPTPGPRGGSADGRWPANVVLSHADGCVQIGTQKVRGSNSRPEHVGAGRDGLHTNGIYGAKQSKVTVSHTDADGMETVEAWECTPDCPVRLLDEQTGVLTSGDADVRRDSGADRNGNQGAAYGAESRAAGTPIVSYGDSGGASRFFYCAKAAKSERNAGLEDKNDHPTVKPINLMRWLVRLVTPPGGTVLDPFAGAGTTGCAAALEGVAFIGVERDEGYVEIARARIDYWSQRVGEPLGTATRRTPAKPKAKTVVSAAQISMDVGAFTVIGTTSRRVA